jgi:hypothetical protein
VAWGERARARGLNRAAERLGGRARGSARHGATSYAGRTRTRVRVGCGEGEGPDRRDLLVSERKGKEEGGQRAGDLGRGKELGGKKRGRPVGCLAA